MAYYNLNLSDFAPLSVFPLVDPWSGRPLVYRPIHEWQQLAQNGQLHPEDQVFDPVRRIWLRAADHLALRPYFPQPVNWPAVLGFGLIVFGLVALAKASANANLVGLPWDEIRVGVFRRDSYSCTYCGHVGNSLTLEVDHAVPVSRGGSDDPETLVTACWRCNREKGTSTGWEYRLSRLFNR